MANTKSARKRIRANEKRRVQNLSYRSRAKTMIKKAEQAIFASKPSEEAIREAVSTLDKAASKGVIHKNNAARRKSRLLKKFNAATANAAASA